MNRTEHLLVIVAEECAELAKECSKALRFGLDDHHPDYENCNKDRILLEYCDLLGAMSLLMAQPEWGFIGADAEEAVRIAKIVAERPQEKAEKIEKYLLVSQECGTLTQ